MQMGLRKLNFTSIELAGSETDETGTRWGDETAALIHDDIMAHIDRSRHLWGVEVVLDACGARVADPYNYR